MFGPHTASVLCTLILVVAALVLEVIAVSEDSEASCDRPLLAWHVWSIVLAPPLCVWMLAYPMCMQKNLQTPQGKHNKFWGQAVYVSVTAFWYLIGFFYVVVSKTCRKNMPLSYLLAAVYTSIFLLI